ncbi:MAG TPA: BMP family ABC transporter substrate-binding protein [Syntrophomonadaceae bacterium]|nr:BMP family ABC transporter substrate-binding protein [Syntrophomonadaceae bacterium]
MKKNGTKWLGLLLLLVFALALLPACSKKTATAPNTANDQQMMVGFIYVGPPGDAGYTYAHDQGRKYLESKLPYVKTIYQENVAEGADTERALNELAQKGCKVIFATSYGYMDSVIEVAKKYPNVVFMHCSGYKRAANVGTYFGRDYQARYLSGLVAGKMTKSNKIGYVAANKIPEVIRCIDAFTVGVREVNPNATVKVVWTNTWYDPTKEKQAALSLIEDGCDLIAQHQDSYAAQQAAEEKGVLAIGCDSDMHSFAPNANLTSPIFNWGPYYVSLVEQVKNGTWKSSDYWGGLEDGIISLAPISDKVPADVKQMVTEKENAIKAKKYDVFKGPILDQDGKVKVAEGQTMTDEQMLSVDWFVQGVLGTTK